MTVRDIRAAARLIGRRNALRYLAIGAASTLVAACTGEGGKAAPAGGAATGTGPVPSPTTAGVMSRAFDAFVKGKWTLESTTPGGETVKGTVTVLADGGGNGGFTLVWAGEGTSVTWSGGWLLRGGHLRVDVYDAPQDVDKLTGGEALTVPKEVEEGASLLLPWKPPGHHGTGDGQQLKVTYKNDVLRIVHTERGGSESVHVCTRVA
ncbi:hypothetical protein [Streptomyces sp. CC208A]|uniref:hypothetical protein n=1 Tax=Streptomyces sp. CC208A TaxID=3044573 RepID=UPI0024A9B701|nr:hypothetical protein [Streptomyces sp. CC208A]